MRKIIKTIICNVFILSTIIILSNSIIVNANQSHSHEYDNGICTCGEYQQPKWHQHFPSGWIISNAGELMWAVQNYNQGKNMENIYITEDITLPDNLPWVPFGTNEYPFTHSIYTYDDRFPTIDLNVQTVNSSNFGLIGITKSVNNESIIVENITIKGMFNIKSSVENVGAIIGAAVDKVKIQNTTSLVNMNIEEGVSGLSRIGGIVGSSKGSLILEKCANNGSLNLDGAYDYVGGLVGYMEGGLIESSINYQNITSNKAKYLGGLVGFVDNSSFEGIKNSANLGVISGSNFDISVNGNTITMKAGELVGYLGNHLSNSVTNNYYIGNDAFGVVINESLNPQAQKTSDDDITSGRLAYLLNDAFGQRIDDLESGTKESKPILGGARVYKVFECDGETVKYSNYNKNTDHIFKYTSINNAIIQTCEVCDHEKKVELRVDENLYYDMTLKSVNIYSDIEGLDINKLEITYSTEPIFPGKYKASFTYQGLEASLDFEIFKGIPLKEMFTLKPQEQLVYDGNNKVIDLVSTKEVGMGEIYYQILKDNKVIPNICDAGTYLVKICVKEGTYYQAYEFDSLDFSVFVTVLPKEITLEWTQTTLFYEEGKNVYIPKYKLNGLCYQDNPSGQFSNIGNGVGTYTTTVTIIDKNYTLVGDNLTTDFEVKGILVKTPDIPHVLRIPGQKQVPEVHDTEYYTVIENKGGSSAGKYPVVLELKDPSKYTWETTDSARITVFFCIHELDSSWELFPSISDWVYGETPLLPVYKVSNSYLDINVTYRKPGGEFSKELPKEVGEYEVKLSSEQDDYRALPLDDVILKFSIVKADPLCAIDSVITVDYGLSLDDIKLTGVGDGAWAYQTPSTKVLDSGTHQVEVVFTPTNTKNYNIITKNITVIVNKVNPLYSAPVAKSNLVYNNTNQTAIIPGSAIGGVMHYKVNDGAWSSELPLVKEAKTYKVYYKVVGDNNHLDTLEKELTVTVTKANLTIKSISITLEQYAKLPKFTYEVVGLLNNDTLVKEPTLEVLITDSKTVGEYEIKVKDAQNDNYNISYVNGTLKIEEHTTCRGGTPTCTKKAVCELCNKEYGDLAPHVFNDYKYNNDASNEQDGTISSKCAHCDEINMKTLDNTKIDTPKAPNTILFTLLGTLFGAIFVCLVLVPIYFFVLKKK